MNGLRFTSNKLIINCQAIVDNYYTVKRNMSKMVRCAANLKANAYGLGAVSIMRALSKAGCNQFFVNNLDEALELRNYSLTDEIYVLNGVFSGEEEEFCQNNLMPVLNSKEQFEVFNRYCRKKNNAFPAILNIDIGINSLGIPLKEALLLFEQDYFKQKISIKFIMSQLDDIHGHHEIDLLQRLQHNMKLPMSLAHSQEIYESNNKCYSDIARLGIILYGINIKNTSFALKSTISLISPIVQIKEEDSKITAIIPIGYADGIHRSIANKQAICYIAGEPVEVIGKISMNAITLDVTNLPKSKLYVGAQVEILGDNAKLKKMAQYADTNCHDIITSLHNNLPRCYL